MKVRNRSLILEKSKRVFNGLPKLKNPKNKKKMDEKLTGRTYKKTKPERGIKQLKPENSRKSKPKGKIQVKRNGKA